MNKILTNSTSTNKNVIKCNIFCQLGCLCAYMAITGCIYVSCTKKNNRTCGNYLCCAFFFWIICFDIGGDIPTSAESPNVEIIEVK